MSLIMTDSKRLEAPAQIRARPLLRSIWLVLARTGKPMSLTAILFKLRADYGFTMAAASDVRAAIAELNARTLTEAVHPVDESAPTMYRLVRGG